MDTGIAIIAALIGGGKDLVLKIFGPTADYIGQVMKDYAKKRIENIGNIVKIAERKLGEKKELPGSVHPKMLNELLGDASFSDEFLAQEYFGGILASSRTENSRDDRGAYFSKLVSRLSVYQLRIHYLFYFLFLKSYRGDPTNIGVENERLKMRIFIPFDLYAKAMDFSKAETVIADAIWEHTISGLIREDLLGNIFRYGQVEDLKGYHNEITAGGIVLTPSLLGVGLFNWAHGFGDTSVHDFLSNEREFPQISGVTIEGNYAKIH